MKRPPVLMPPGGGEFGWHDRDLSFEGIKEWARRGFDPKLKPTREEIANADLKWDQDLDQWMYIFTWVQDIEKTEEQFRVKF